MVGGPLTQAAHARPILAANASVAEIVEAHPIRGHLRRAALDLLTGPKPTEGPGAGAALPGQAGVYQAERFLGTGGAGVSQANGADSQVGVQTCAAAD